MVSLAYSLIPSVSGLCPQCSLVDDISNFIVISSDAITMGTDGMFMPSHELEVYFLIHVFTGMRYSCVLAGSLRLQGGKSWLILSTQAA